MDAHAAERAAPAEPTGRLHARQGHGRQPLVGRGEDHHHHVQVFHPVFNNLLYLEIVDCDH